MVRKPCRCSPAYLVAARGHDAAPLVAALAARGIEAAIALRPPRGYDAARYAQRHPVERLFSRLKPFRRLATREEKLDTLSLALMPLAAPVLWLRDS